MNLALRLFFLFLAIVIASFAIGYRYVMLQVSEPLPIDQPITLELQRGESIYHVARQLHQQQLINHIKPFVYYARYMDQAHQIKAGEYLLEPGATLSDILDQLVEGRVIQYSVTLVEGHTTAEFVRKLHLEERLNRELTKAQVSDLSELMALLGNEGVHPEGQFFPATYFFHKGESELDVLRRAYEKMQQVLAEEWQDKGKALPYESPYEALIMASIVEKETGVESERSDIAAVFVRRLEKGMRLQTDPTVIYGLGASYQGNIKRKHLKQKTAYNTYVIKGLPPTPIANPGREAIHAALHPSNSEALYFVAKGDGSHAFSKTLAEHNKAVRQYQLKRRTDYRSAPQQQ
ncbi:MAG: endolytic transglycosylase MltG [Pseudomonadales bacterium]|nr:endolytic transglycosylase MltG [Pseudomonadales bacterium]